MPRFIECETRGGAARLWLNRPRIHNAIHAGLIEELTAAVRRLGSDPGVRVLVLGGRGRSFCVGADLHWMMEKGGASEEENRQDARRLAAMLRALHDCPLPTVARVHGLTIGGGNGMVAACDLAVASTEARFRTAETKLGIVPAVISPYLFRRLGDRRCRELFLTAGEITAEQARDYGLVNRVVEPGRLDEAVDEWVAALLRNGPCALREAKQLLGRVAALDLDEAGEYTAALIARLRSSPEGREGMRAFFDKRAPAWAAERKDGAE